MSLQTETWIAIGIAVVVGVCWIITLIISIQNETANDRNIDEWREDRDKFRDLADELQKEITEREAAARKVIEHYEHESGASAPYCLQVPVIQGLWESMEYFGKDSEPK